MTTVTVTNQFSTVLNAALAELEKFTGPEIDALKASAKQTIEAAVSASGPIAQQVFNIGLEAVPGLKLFAPAIEVVADPIVSGFVSGEAKQLETNVEGSDPLPQ